MITLQSQSFNRYNLFAEIIRVHRAQRDQITKSGAERATVLVMKEILATMKVCADDVVLEVVLVDPKNHVEAIVIGIHRPT